MLLHVSLLLQLSWAVHAQARLMAEVNAMLSSFAEQKAAAVASAVAGMHGVLAQGRSGTETSFTALSRATSSANDAIKAGPAGPTLYMFEVLSVGPKCIGEQPIGCKRLSMPAAL